MDNTQQREIVERFQSTTIVPEQEGIKIQFEVNKDVDKIMAIQLASDSDLLLFHRGTIQMTVNGSEVFPEGWHCKKLMAGLGVDPNHRMYDLQGKIGLDRGNGSVSIALTDIDNDGMPYAPYNRHVYIKSTVKETSS